MFLMLSKKPRKANRSRSNRFRAKLKAKNKSRRARVYQAHKALATKPLSRRKGWRPRASGLFCAPSSAHRSLGDKRENEKRAEFPKENGPFSFRDDASQITPNFFPTLCSASRPRSSCSRECVAM